MIKEQQMVREFITDVVGLKDPDSITVPSVTIMRLRSSLMTEELEETNQAMALVHNSPSITAIIELADGLADLLYVVYGTANAYGIDLEEVFNEVHRSNMTKKGGKIRADGKQLKPETFEPPKLYSILLKQCPIAAYVNDEPVAWILPDGTIIHKEG